MNMSDLFELVWLLLPQIFLRALLLLESEVDLISIFSLLIPDRVMNMSDLFEPVLGLAMLFPMLKAIQYLDALPFEQHYLELPF
jgi:hypothetical protein